jgi:membrane protein implicated in regulation of membrane protease activity
MTWATFYLVCFISGVALSVLSFLSSGLHLPHFHLHLPHGYVVVPHAPHIGGAGHLRTGAAGGHTPFFNFATIPAFLTWFGGVGYLLTLYSTMVVAGIVVSATAAGLLGAAVIFWFLVRLLLTHDEELDPADYDRVGVLGTITSPIGAGGTGEMIFSLAGTRHTCGARSEDRMAVPRGAEVMITRYEHGIAYVRRWEEAVSEADDAKSE